MGRRKHKRVPKDVFRDAIDTADHLQWQAGLQAIKKGEGRGLVSGADPEHLLGGAAMDDDCKSAYPNDARWDYVLGYRRANEAVAQFVEVHSAETSSVSKMAEKLDWLLQFLERQAQVNVAKLRREIHWVASGRDRILPHTPQYRRLNTTLRRLGLKGPVKHLVLA